MRWSKAEITEFMSLHREGKYFWREIAEKMGKTHRSVEGQGRSLGLVQSSFVRSRAREWNRKHVHLREQVMTYLLTHTDDETTKHFGLTSTNLKSLRSSCYRLSEYSHLRKDTRRHDPWSLKEILFLIRHAGLQSRSWIGRKLKRGGVECVKASLSRLNTRSNHLNGMPLQWAELLLIDTSSMIKTHAGPRKGERGRFCIIPWVVVEISIQDKKIDPQVKTAIHAMAKFQRWIHGIENDDAKLISRLKRYAGTK